MRVINVSLSELESKVLMIGFEGENQITQVRIDAAEILTDHPNATPTLIAKPLFGFAYPVIVTKKGTAIVWEIDNSVLSFHGDGEIQLTFTEGTVIAKSYVGRIRIRRSLAVNGEKPDPIETWEQAATAKLAEVDAQIGELEDMVEAAEAAKDQAQDIVDDAAADIQAAGAAQVQVVQAKGTEVLNSIPADYTELSDDVTDLKSAIDVTLISWEQGTYGSGRPGSSTKRIRTVGAFKVAYPFTVKAISGYGYNVFYGTTEDTPYQYYTEWQTEDHTYFDTSLYYRITASHNDQSNIYPTEKPVDLAVNWDFYSQKLADVDRILLSLQWEQGNINSSGANINANNRIRTVGSFQPVCPFVVTASEGYGFNVYVSDVGGTPVPLYTSWQSGPIIYTDTNKIYRISVRKNDDSNFTPINNAVAVEWAYQNEIESTNNSLIPLCVEDDNYFTWERGTINGQGGDDNSTTRIRTRGTYGFTTLFQVSCDTGYGYNVFVSNVGGTPLPLFNAWQTGTMTFQIDATKIYRFSFAKLNSSTIVVADSVHFHLKRLDSNLFVQADNPIMPYGAWFRTYSHSIENTKAPKNTLSACKVAYAMGYRWLESDIHMTSDNVPVMCHNATINATSDYTGDKTIAEMTYAELLEYDFGSWFSSDFAGEKILTLDTLCKFAYTHDCGLSLECKKDYSWTAETILIVYNIVKKNNMLGRVIWNNAGVSAPMTLMKALDPNQDFAFFYENAIPSSFDAITAFKTANNRVEVCDYLSSWTQEKVDAAKVAGLICLAHHVTYGITENLTIAEYKTIIDMGFEATLVQGINTTKWASEMFE